MRQDESTPTPREGGVAKGRWTWLMAGVILCAVPLLGWLTSRSSNSSGSPAPASSRTSSGDGFARWLGSVKIRVSGVPKHASIAYDGTPVLSNPFLVQSSNALMPIQIKATGYDPITATVIPNKDTVVRVTLTPIRTSETN